MRQKELVKYAEISLSSFFIQLEHLKHSIYQDICTLLRCCWYFCQRCAGWNKLILLFHAVVSHGFHFISWFMSTFFRDSHRDFLVNGLWQVYSDVNFAPRTWTDYYVMEASLPHSIHLHWALHPIMNYLTFCDELIVFCVIIRVRLRLHPQLFIWELSKHRDHSTNIYRYLLVISEFHVCYPKISIGFIAPNSAVSD